MLNLPWATFLSDGWEVILNIITKEQYEFALNRAEYFKGERDNLKLNYSRPSELGARVKRTLFGSIDAPETFKILANRLVIPECFVNIFRF